MHIADTEEPPSENGQFSDAEITIIDNTCSRSKRERSPLLTDKEQPSTDSKVLWSLILVETFVRCMNHEYKKHKMREGFLPWWTLLFGISFAVIYALVHVLHAYYMKSLLNVDSWQGSSSRIAAVSRYRFGFRICIDQFCVRIANRVPFMYEW